MGNGKGMMTMNLGTVWKLLRPSWCPHPHASLIEEVTERVRLTPTKDEDLGTLDVIHKMILPQSKESGEATSKLESVKKLEPGSCLDLTCGGGEHTCDGRSCVRIQSFQREDLVAWFGDITEREKSEEEDDMTHEKMTELEPLLEASGERNLRSIEITHGECPCHCLAHTVWYPEHSNLCLVWDVEEIRSIGLPDHRQKVTLLVVSTMLALRWIEENVTKYRESKTPTAESIYAIDYSRRLELFETACKVFAIMEVGHVWSRIRFFPWFRATLTSWLYMMTKDHMKKHSKEYRQFLAEIGPEIFKRSLLTYRNAITTGWKRVGRVSRDNTKARESILEEDLAKNVSLSLYNSFCLNRELKVKGLPNQAKRLQEQREWMQSFEQLKAREEIVISSDDDEALLRQITVSNSSRPSTSKARNTK